jgi:hypothetical protein
MTEIPTIDEFLPYIESVLRAVHTRLLAGGIKYGEDVLFEMAESGAVTWCYTKAARIKWSKDQGLPISERKDSYLDLAGYAVLEMARQAYLNGDAEVDGLFDRHGDSRWLFSVNPNLPPAPEPQNIHEESERDAFILIQEDEVSEQPPDVKPAAFAFLEEETPPTPVNYPHVVAPPDLGPAYSEAYWKRVAKEETKSLEDVIDEMVEDNLTDDPPLVNADVALLRLHRTLNALRDVYKRMRRKDDANTDRS